MLDFIARAIDSTFLSNEVDSLVVAHERIKKEIQNRKTELADYESLLEERQEDITRATYNRNSVLGEIEQLSGIKVNLINGESVLIYKKEQITKLNEEIEDLESHKRNLESLIDGLHQELELGKEEIDKLLKEYHTKRLVEIEETISKEKKDTLQTLKSNLELEILAFNEEKENTLKSLKSTLESEVSALTMEGQTSKEVLRETVETLENQRVEAIKGFKEELREWEERIEVLKRNHQQEYQSILTKGREVLDIERAKFFNQRDTEINRLEQQRLLMEDKLKNQTRDVLKENEGLIVGPYLKKIELLEAELVTLHSQLTAKADKNLDWSIGQIEIWLTKTRGGRKEPQHLRIAGESESGKSHLVNSLITEGLQHFGIEADYQILDPFPSQTDWAISPTISNNAEKCLESLQQWANKSDDDSSGLDRPMIVVIDEIDRMIMKFKGEMVSAIRSIWAGGRHKSIFLWAIGQNANVKKLNPLDWSDLDNASQIYLNSSGLQFIKNGLEGQNTRALEGTLNHLKTKSRYYAVVKSKGLEPYAVSRPLKLFVTGTTPPPSPSPSPSPHSSEGLVCAHCGSSKVHRAGKVNDKPRVKCLDCNRQSYGK
jgi:hypothetical protein